MTTIHRGHRILTCAGPDVHEAGRICAHDGCGIRLSRYNPTDYCGPHKPEPDWVYNGYLTGVCPACGHVGIINRGASYRRCQECGLVRGVGE